MTTQTGSTMLNPIGTNTKIIIPGALTGEEIRVAKSRIVRLVTEEGKEYSLRTVDGELTLVRIA